LVKLLDWVASKQTVQPQIRVRAGHNSPIPIVTRGLRMSGGELTPHGFRAYPDGT